MTRARVETLSRLAIVVGLAAHAVMFIWVIAGRITFPYELEWMTGSVLDHVERVREGLPVYTAPSARWIPFLYPPLYYWVCAALGGSILVCRLVSLGSSLLQLVLAYGIARRLGATRFWSFVASGLFLACFSYVGWWYDLERTDALFAALMVAAAAILVRSRGPIGSALAGVLIGVGFLAKQQTVFYAAGAGLGLLLATRFAREEERARPRDVVVFSASVAVSLVGAIAYAVHREGHWFVYYVLEMPRAHGVLWRLAPSMLGRDFAAGFAIVGVTIAVGILVARRLRDKSLARAELVFASMLVFGFAAAAASRLHIGGWINVLQPWTAFAAIATAVVASRLAAERAEHPRVVPAIAIVLVAQLAVWAYEPGSYCPSRKARALNEAFLARIHALEANGEVMVSARGHVTVKRHPHVSALADVVRVDHHSPRDLVVALDNRSYAAVIDGAREDGEEVDPDWPPVLLEDFRDLERPLLEHYFVSERLDADEVSPTMPSPVHPIWIYLPRTKPLDGASMADLRKRHFGEMRLASSLASARLDGRTMWFDGRQIEDLAPADVGLGGKLER